MSKTIYLTTPLYYVNAAPHIGHSYTEIAADCVARFHRLNGAQVFLLTGTDEHGQKIEQAAAAAGQSPQAFADQVVERFASLWKALAISYDDFIRTTQPRHTRAVQALLTALHREGKLIRMAYQGWYCTPDETFWTEAELGPRPGGTLPLCPSCGRSLEPVEEDGWHLPLEASRPWLRGFVASHPRFVQPVSRYHELSRLLDQPLPESLCITRPRQRVGWGIPVPFSPEHVTYVWFDALLNYITVPGVVDDRARFDALWPADVHFIGKDILRHHAVYWPIILHALGMTDAQMPKMIFAHGWWKIGEQKMSKSLGNIVDPSVVIGELLKAQPYAADVYRYFLLREIPFGQDGAFSEEALMKRLDSDLANDLGNLVNRTCSMIERYCEAKIPQAPSRNEISVIGGGLGLYHHVMGDPDQGSSGLAVAVSAAIERFQFSIALEAIMRVVTQANQYVEQMAPWKLAKQSDEHMLREVLGTLAESIRIVAIALEPFMPAVADAIWRQLGCADAPRRLEDAARWGVLSAGQRIGEHPVLFPRTGTKAASR